MARTAHRDHVWCIQMSWIIFILSFSTLQMLSTNYWLQTNCAFAQRMHVLNADGIFYPFTMMLVCFTPIHTSAALIRLMAEQGIFNHFTQILSCNWWRRAVLEEKDQKRRSLCSHQNEFNNIVWKYTYSDYFPSIAYRKMASLIGPT
jgi:hypothetical protein